MRALDLYCGAGGASKGLMYAGFTVDGVDISEQPNWPGEKFTKADAIEFLENNQHYIRRTYDYIHASPPCQGYSPSTWDQSKHPLLVEPTIKLLEQIGLPYDVENVPNAFPDMRADFTLCGEMFGLRVIRHRIFQTNWKCPKLEHKKHRGTTIGASRPGRRNHKTNHLGYYYPVYGSGGGKGTIQDWQNAMGIHWTTVKHEIAEAIPPAYTEYIGKEFVKRENGNHQL